MTRKISCTSCNSICLSYIPNFPERIFHSSSHRHERSQKNYNYLMKYSSMKLFLHPYSREHLVYVLNAFYSLIVCKVINVSANFLFQERETVCALLVRHRQMITGKVNKVMRWRRMGYRYDTIGMENMPSILQVICV